MPLFEACRVFVAPLRSGAGVKGKILQSMSYGLPVVTTDVGAEGLELQDGETAMIARDAETFAEKVIELYCDAELWTEISRNSVEQLRRTHTVETCRATLEEILSAVPGAGKSPARKESLAGL